MIIQQAALAPTVDGTAPPAAFLGHLSFVRGRPTGKN